MAQTYPAFAVEMAPGVAASDLPVDPDDWVDVTDRVESLSTFTGRQSELDQPGAGTATLVLDNSDGELDPDNSSGTYYGDLVEGMWFRILGGTTTANTDVFYGHVSTEGFKITAGQFPDQYVTVNLVDDLERLAHTQLPSSVYRVEVETDTPVAWYRLGEGYGTVMTDSSGNNHHGTYAGGATFNSRDGLIANDDNNAIEFDGATQYAVVPQTSAITDGTFSVEVWANFAAANTSRTFVYQGVDVHFGSSGIESTLGAGRFKCYWLGIEVDPLGGSGTTLAFVVGNGSAVKHVRATLPSYDETHHIVATYSAGTMHIYVDNVDVGLTTVTAGSPAAPSLGPTMVGAYAFDGGADAFAFMDGTLDEVAVYGSALSAARVAAHYTAGTEPWGSETTSARVTHLLDAVDYHANRNIDTGRSTMPPADLGG